jgi:metal-sulfur cluster biosynthetic enzyme
MEKFLYLEIRTTRLVCPPALIIMSQVLDAISSTEGIRRIRMKFKFGNTKTRDHLGYLGVSRRIIL